MSETYLLRLRHLIEGQYKLHPTGAGGSFGEILCYEIHHGSNGVHTGGLTFNWLAEKWGISVTALGELIYDHCKRLEEEPRITFEIQQDELAEELEDEN